MSVGCLALNGYAIHREIKTYNCIRRFLSSSSRSCFSCKSTSVFSEATDGEGLVGLGKEFARDDPTLWFNVSTDTALEGERDRDIAVVFGTSRLLLPPSEWCEW